VVVEHPRSLDELLGEAERAARIPGEEDPLGHVGVRLQVRRRD
jgi:hypothetical protein